jgi:hypothetical protein
MYGIFFEDINFAADGGLYAELVRNRSFEFLPVDNRNYTRADRLGGHRDGRRRRNRAVALQVADSTDRFLHHDRGRLTIGPRTAFMLSWRPASALEVVDEDRGQDVLGYAVPRTRQALV